MAELRPRRHEHLVVATYNVHAWLGTDGRFDPDRTLAVIRALGADIVALQEVTLGPKAQGVIDADYLAEATGMQVILGPTLKRGTADFGNALLTAWPVAAIRRHDISFTRGEPRGLLEVGLELDQVQLRVLSTHFGKGPDQRRWQARKTVRLLDSRPAGAGAVVLMGDINEWVPGRASLRILDRWFGPAPAHRTYPASLPLLKLDRIWIRPRGLARSYRAVRTAATRLASDHLPLCAELSHPAATRAPAAPS